jgi:hypothetical protein
MRAILLISSALFFFIVSVFFAETCHGQDTLDGYLLNPKNADATPANSVIP